MNLREITFEESINIYGGDEPAYGIGYYIGEGIHFLAKVASEIANSDMHS